VGLVLLALLDRRVRRFEVGVVGEALHSLLREVAVGHRVAEDGDTLAVLSQQRCDVAGRLALPGARSHRADGDDRLRRGEHRLLRREQAVRGPGGERARGDVHHVLVGHVRVREDDLVDIVLADELLELGLRVDRDPGGVEVAGELLRVAPPVDVRDLGRGERDDLVGLAAAIDEVEVVEIASGGSGDEHASSIHE
jgi:hypothetical protein